MEGYVIEEDGKLIEMVVVGKSGKELSLREKTNYMSQPMGGVMSMVFATEEELLGNGFLKKDIAVDENVVANNLRNHLSKLDWVNKK